MVSFVVLLGIPTMVMANTGSALVLAGAGHLLYGNFLIGIFEGLIIARLSGLKKRWAILAMVLANYFSAFLGFYLLATINYSGLYDINYAMRQFWMIVVVAFLMTILLEWPVIALCFRKHKKWFKMSVLASILVQTLSYIAICSWYCMVTDLSLFKNVVAPAEISIREDVLIYYIADKDGDVYCRTAAGHEEMVYDLNSTDPSDQLIIRKMDLKPDMWELCVSDRNAIKTTVIREGLPSKSVPGIVNPQQRDNTRDSLGKIDPRRMEVFSCNRDSPWRIMNWYSMIYVEFETELLFTIRYEMPLSYQTIRAAIELPGGKMLFQLGENQICIIDLEKRQTALVARGRGPIAILKKGSSAE